MNILGFSINTIIVVLIIGYILYIHNIQATIPKFIHDLFNNFLFRLSVMLLIIFISIGHKETGFGGPMIGILIAIAYIFTENYILPLTMEGFQEDEETGEDEAFGGEETGEELSEGREDA